MSAIPETRKIDRQRRIVIPRDISPAVSPGDTFEVARDGDSIVLIPSDGEDSYTVARTNRVRLSAEVVTDDDIGAEFAVVRDGEEIRLIPEGDVNITF